MLKFLKRIKKNINKYMNKNINLLMKDIVKISNEINSGNNRNQQIHKNKIKFAKVILHEGRVIIRNEHRAAKLLAYKGNNKYDIEYVDEYERTKKIDVLEDDLIVRPTWIIQDRIIFYKKKEIVRIDGFKYDGYIMDIKEEDNKLYYKIILWDGILPRYANGKVVDQWIESTKILGIRILK